GTSPGSIPYRPVHRINGHAQRRGPSAGARVQPTSGQMARRLTSKFPFQAANLGSYSLVASSSRHMLAREFSLFQDEVEKVELPAIEQLTRLGWTYIPGADLAPVLPVDGAPVGE